MARQIFSPLIVQVGQGLSRVPFPALRLLFAGAQTGLAKRHDGLGELRVVFEQALVLGGRQGRQLGARDGRPHERARLGHGRRVLVPRHQQHRDLNRGERRGGVVAQHAQHAPRQDGRRGVQETCDLEKCHPERQEGSNIGNEILRRYAPHNDTWKESGDR